MNIKILFTLSRELNPKHAGISLGKYLIEPIPMNSSDINNSNNRYLLKFNDEIKDGEIRSNPEVEAKLLWSFFSLLTGAKLNIESSMINNIKILNTDIYKEFRYSIDDISDFSNQYEELNKFDSEIAKQFIRACDVYRLAINLVEENNTLSFFLLCISIECLSNKTSTKTGNCEKFVDFIFTYLPDKSDFKTQKDWIGILKEIYYNHRSGFTHGGKSIPEAVKLADKLNRKYVRNTIKGKEIRTPGLRWFSKIVRNCLLGFLISPKNKMDNIKINHLKEISLDSGIVNLKAKRNIKKGRFVTTNDVELD